MKALSRLLLAAVLLLACTPTNAARLVGGSAYDGTWSVAIYTQRGACSSVRVAVRIAGGRVYSEDQSYQSNGFVSANGAVRVSVAGAGRSASGSGRLSRNSGAGRWMSSRGGIALVEDSEQGFVPVQLNRVCGIDHTETLYIGKTGSLRSRLSSLVRTNNPSFGHGGGHAHMPDTLRRRFPFKLRAVTWWRSSDLWNGETELFEKYTKRFGELPPMNLNG